MSSVDFSFVDDSSSDEEFDLHEEEEIAMLVAMHKRKKPKHGGSVYGRAFIRRRCTTRLETAMCMTNSRKI